MTDTPLHHIPEKLAPVAAPAERPEPSPLNALIWRLWPFMAWLLPVALLGLLYSADVGGWEMVIVVLYSPVIIPAYALLNLIPRWIIRKRKDLPNGSTALTCLLILHWWGLTALVLFLRGTGDSGELSSYVGELLIWAPPELENSVAVLGAAVSLMAWIGLLLWPALPIPKSARKHKWFWPLFAFVIPPLTVTLTLTSMYTIGMNDTPDAGGFSEAQAERLPTAEARESRSNRWNELQETLVPLRTGIAADGWVAEQEAHSETGFVDSSGLRSGSHLESFQTSLPGYTIDIIWSTQINESFASARSRVSELAHQQGWATTHTEQYTRLDEQENEILYGEELMFNDSDGNTFHVSIEVPQNDGTPLASGTSIVTVRARSPEFWREGGLDLGWQGAATPAELEELAWVTFTSTEWPELRVFQALEY